VPPNNCTYTTLSKREGMEEIKKMDKICEIVVFLKSVIVSHKNDAKMKGN